MEETILKMFDNIRIGRNKLFRSIISEFSFTVVNNTWIFQIQVSKSFKSSLTQINVN